MSMILMAKAFGINVGNASRKLVLLKLADNANDSGECWPSYKHIAEQCEMSKRSAMNHIEALCEAGYVIKHSRKGVKGNATNIYQLNLEGEKSAPLPVEGEEDSLGGSENSALGGEKAAPGGSENSAPGTSHSLEPAKEPKTRGTNAYPEDFEEAWNSYPKREGNNPKNYAFSAWKARVAEGVSPADMIAGVHRYARFCEAKGSVHTSFVMQAKRFFGTSREFENDWVVATTHPAKFGRHTGLVAPSTDGLVDKGDGTYGF
jgi:biotin operon repressor